MNHHSTSALYFLVWHLGMPHKAALARYLAADPVIRRYWAIRGRLDGVPCFDALARFVDRCVGSRS